MNALELRGVSKRLGTVLALDSVDLDVGPREFVVVLGPTGAGKTTLLRTIAGLERADGGELRLFGADARALEPAQRDVALVFQNFSLYPSQTVRGNLEFPLRAPGRALTQAQIDERVAWAASLLHIERLLDRPARRLSGGEMQRVAIGRAIVRRPRLFLMDEPLTNLDAKLREELRVELRELARRLETPVVWVTHDSAEALSMSDRVVVLSQGRVLQSGTPREIYARPASPLVALQLGSPPMNVLDVEARDAWWTTSGGARVAPSRAATGTLARIGFRPEHVRLERGHGDARVEVLEELGAQRVALLDWRGARIHALLADVAGLDVHAPVAPQLDPAHVVVWSRE